MESLQEAGQDKEWSKELWESVGLSWMLVATLSPEKETERCRKGRGHSKNHCVKESAGWKWQKKVF